jgi:hypothetical protein
MPLKRIAGIILHACLLITVATQAQKVTFSEPVREDTRDINFEVIGKVNNHILIFKNVRWKYAISLYDEDMKFIEKVPLDFMPEKTYNVDYAYVGDRIHMVYQVQKRGVVYCYAATLDQNAKPIGEPVQIDTTDLGNVSDNNIYSTILSEDRKRIMVFKLHRRNNNLFLGTQLFNRDMKLEHRTRYTLEYNERRQMFSEFLLDNDGHLVFTRSSRKNIRENFSGLELMIKPAFTDTVRIETIEQGELFTDEIKLKVDNLNKRYLINSFFYTESRGNIQGLFTVIWNAQAQVGESLPIATIYNTFPDSLRSVAKASGALKFAFNDFFIRHIVVKRDGGFLIAAEDHTTHTSGGNNMWNRWDYMNWGWGPWASPFNSFNYNPFFFGFNDWGGFYRPFNSFNNMQNTRFFYDNILLLSVEPNGVVDWNTVIQKQQYFDNNDNYLSYGLMNMNGAIHFLFNHLDKRDKYLSDQAVEANGELRRNPTIKSYLKGYEFMPRFAKQIGSRQVIIPCTYRSLISFAKVEF